MTEAFLQKTKIAELETARNCAEQHFTARLNALNVALMARPSSFGLQRDSDSYEAIDAMGGGEVAKTPEHTNRGKFKNIKRGRDVYQKLANISCDLFRDHESSLNGKARADGNGSSARSFLFEETERQNSSHLCGF